MMILTRRRLLGQAASISALAAAPRLLQARQSAPVVETDCGRMRGSVEDAVHVFRGIPYGGPTGGPNRFIPPIAPTAWTSVRDVTQPGQTAAQPPSPLHGVDPALTGPFAPMFRFYSDPPGVPMGEDCLVLNVWTPEPKAGARRPVMVWLHGGGLTQGSGSASIFNGANLSRDEGVVVVTLNHRLGALGYLDLGPLLGEEFASSGNVGMLDIVSALRWVQRNIERFGGDPARVTIFGESGGGYKVCVLLAMPDAHELFHRAIIQSGPLLRVLDRSDAADLAERLLTELQLTKADARKLQSMPLDRLFAAQAAVERKRQELAGSPPIPFGNFSGFGPVMDGRILPRHPFEPNAPAVSAGVPLMIGWTETEATLFLRADQEASKLDDAGLHRRVNKLLGAHADEVIRVYRECRPGLSPSELYALIATDHHGQADSIAIAERKGAQGKAGVYVYEFTWQSPFLNGTLKSFHSSELPFVFRNIRGPLASALVGDGAELQSLADSMSKAWASFAKSGDPGTKALAWPAYDASNRATMIFDECSRVVNDPYRAEREIIAATRPKQDG